MPRKKATPIEDLSPQTKELYDVVNKEADLPCALVCASFLDACLRSLLERSFSVTSVAERMLNPLGGSLGSYGSRCDLAYCLGLVPKGLYSNLGVVGEIRNQLGHSHVLRTFESPGIRELCMKLSFPHVDTRLVLGDSPRLGGDLWPGANDPRSKFTIIAVLMVDRLLLTGLGLTHRPEQLKGWD